MRIKSSKQVFGYPFPHLIIENFLTEQEQEEIVNEILEVQRNEVVNKVMGGRYQYKPEFFKDGSNSKKIFNFFNSLKTYDEIFNLLMNKDNNYSNFILRNNFNSIIKKYGKKEKFLSKIFPFFFKKSFFLHMDFSIAKKNYFREPHHDKKTRIISFLLYLNSLSHESGGALEIYKYKESKPNFYQFPEIDKLEIYNKISPNGGKLIVFLSSPDSVHGVEKFLPKSDEKRFFLYGSYTSFFDVNWLKDKKNLNLNT